MSSRQIFSAYILCFQFICFIDYSKHLMDAFFLLLFFCLLFRSFVYLFVRMLVCLLTNLLPSVLVFVSITKMLLFSLLREIQRP